MKLLRIAWIGPMPNEEGGASGVSNQLLREIDKHNVTVDCYVPGDEQAIPLNLRHLKNVRFSCISSGWQWGRWYSRNRLMSFVTGQMANLRCENRLARLLVEEHRQKPYDVIYQFSHIEFSHLRRFKNELPPIVLHPSVHAMGELRWHRAERQISKSCEPPLMRIGARCMLYARSLVQRKHIHLADRVLGLSDNFIKELSEDYQLPLELTRIVPNPIDLDRFVPDSSRKNKQNRFVLLFVSRIAVRKGVEMIVDLSHRLDDLADQVELRVVGDKSQWSDYTRLLKQLNPRVATYIGTVSGKGGDMIRLYQTAHMLIQPSRYEPFGLTVGEALACGTPVVASDRVGAAEHVDRRVCRVFADGNVDHLEGEVRGLIHDLRDRNFVDSILEQCRSECARLYAGSVVTSKLLASLREPCTKTSDGTNEFVARASV